ncbi:reverse transcriptase [Corchorus capsularis]|uniref:Reverse transcriptase n=1 Tax=Corchorus capsularis TaxID=210143 RepID=A0A1R3HLF2_COCAP|nr:reverse transcriptase [Corchorus capsularis]
MRRVREFSGDRAKSRSMVDWRSSKVCFWILVEIHDKAKVALILAGSWKRNRFSIRISMDETFLEDRKSGNVIGYVNLNDDYTCSGERILGIREGTETLVMEDALNEGKSCTLCFRLVFGLAVDEMDLEIQLEDGDEVSFALTKYMVPGKILVNRILNRRGVVSVLRGIWPLEIAPCIREVGDNLYGISFKTKKERDRALEEGPWFIKGSCMMMKKWQPGCNVAEMDFQTVSFWIQVHNLPIEMLTRSNANIIGSRMGRVIKIEDPVTSGGLGRSFLRIRIEIDAHNALVDGFWVPRKNMEKVWAEVKYERLADFCYCCGKLGHVLKQCPENDGEDNGEEKRYRYGPHMRAIPAHSVSWMSAIGKENRRVDPVNSERIHSVHDDSRRWERNNFGDTSRGGILMEGGQNSMIDKGKKTTWGSNFMSLQLRASGSAGFDRMDSNWRFSSRSHEKDADSLNVIHGSQLHISDIPVSTMNMTEPAVPLHGQAVVNFDDSTHNSNDRDPGLELDYPPGVVRVQHGSDNETEPPVTPDLDQFSDSFIPNTYSETYTFTTPVENHNIIRKENLDVIATGNLETQPSDIQETLFPNTSLTQSGNPIPVKISTLPENTSARIFIFDKSLNTYILVTTPLNNIVDNIGEEESMDRIVQYRREFLQHDHNTKEILSSGIRDLRLKRGIEEVDTEIGMMKRRKIESGIVIRETVNINEDSQVPTGRKSASGQKGKKKELKQIIHKYDPDVVFLMETRNGREMVEKIRKKMGYPNVIYVDPVGLSGGLSLWWKKEYVVSSIEESKNVIDTVFELEDGGDKHRIMRIYGAPVYSDRKLVWEKINRKTLSIEEKWMCIGDWNDLEDVEKEGGRPKERRVLQNFRTVVEFCQLLEVPSQGQQFTWSGIRDGEIIKEKLDRCLVNLDWLEQYPRTQVWNLPAIGSDHSPLVINTVVGDKKGAKLFKFEAIWLEKEDCKRIIGEGWNKEVDGSRAYKVVCKLKRCRELLKEWCRENNKDRKMKENLRAAIADIQDVGKDIEDRECIEDMTEQLHKIMEQEEVYWHQRARVNWLKCGDKNTHFFHQTTLQRRQKNKVLRLKSGDQWLEAKEDIMEEFTKYYENIFSTSGSRYWDSVLNHVPVLINDEMNDFLTRRVTMEVVNVATFQMGELKSPGLDGFNGLLFQQNWEVVKDDIYAMVQSFFDSGRMLRELNNTDLVMIPKIKGPESVTQFRPISLCNYAYKIISKVMVNKLKGFMGDLVTENQSAFVHGRQIHDNVLIAQEVFHYLKIKKKGKQSDVAVKIDMSKAYDRVEWGFLKVILMKMGMNPHWCNMISECVSTVSYTIVINGKTSRGIFPSRGLRQGDPLSPYLFLLVIDSLSRMIQAGNDSKHIAGIKVSRSCPELSHLLFTDDSLFFLQANSENCSRFLHILQEFADATGQIINLEKSSLIFSANAPVDLRAEISQRLQIQEAANPGIYLGFQSTWGKTKCGALHYITERVQAKLNVWKQKLLSLAGKEWTSMETQQAIEKIPLGVFDRADRRTWPYTKNGRYTVRSGYYAIRTSHCEFVYKQKEIDLGGVVYRIQSAVREFVSLRSKNQLDEVELSRLEEQQLWTKSPPGWIKINSDGSFCKKYLAEGFGIVIRDEEGNVLDAFSSSVKAVDALSTEALALRESERHDEHRLWEDDNSINLGLDSPNVSGPVECVIRPLICIGPEGMHNYGLDVQPLVVVKKKKKLLNRIPEDGKATVPTIFGYSISDSNIENRNRVLMEEEEAIWEISSTLHVVYNKDKQEVVRALIEQEKGSKIVGKEVLEMVFIQESKLSRDSKTLIKLVWGKGGCSGDMNSEGASSGLVTVWKDDFFEKEFAIMRSRFIVVVGVLKSNGVRVGFGNFYAPNDDAERVLFFHEVKQVIGGYNIPWVLGGYFNVVRCPDEKIGVVYNQGAMRCSVEFAEDLALIDLPLMGGRIHDENLRSKLTELKVKLWNLYRAEEQAWCQKLRFKWLQEGDRNTRFYHLVASVRNRVNCIKSLEFDCRTIEDPLELKDYIADDFEKHFNQNLAIGIEDFGGDFSMLSHQNFEWLQRPFDEEEILDAIHSCDGSKAPGSDGFNLNLFKKYWGVVKKDILAKVLARRLSSVMKEIIGPSQFAFIRGRQILNGFLIANETIDVMKKDGVGGVCFKVDFEKAYDSINWDFLRFAMRKVGFRQTWINWIVSCITTTSISILVNGSPSRQFGMMRGLRQRCPLSLLLFNIAREMFAMMVRNAVEKRLIEGVKVGNNGFEVNLLQYAYDSILFSKPETEKKFCIVRLNLFLVILGLPLGANPCSKKIWKLMVDRFQSRLSRWNGSHLSMAGRVALIKLVLSSMPSYYMSLFPILQRVKESLDETQRKFLWNGAMDSRKMHLVDWNTICNPKEMGGLGIVDLKLKNRALLNKWLWRFSDEDKILWRKVIIEKYSICENSLLPVGINRRRCSRLWWRIVEPIYLDRDEPNLTTEGMRIEVGNGALINFWNNALINFWNDALINGMILKDNFPRIFVLTVNKNAKIGEFGVWIEDKWEWKIHLRRCLFDWENFQWVGLIALLDNVTLSHEFKDKLIWKHSSSGLYSVKEFYKFVCYQNNSPDPIWRKIWLELAPPKVEMLLWQSIRGRIAVKSLLYARGLLSMENIGCHVCNEELETVDHIFLKCKRSWLVWQYYCAKWKVSWVMPMEVSSAFQIWIDIYENSVWRMTFYAILWTLWTVRNDAIFNGSSMEVSQIQAIVDCRIAFWCKAKWPNSAVTIDDYLRGLECVQVPDIGVKRRLHLDWLSPVEGQLKINVDGAARGQPGEARIGGVLRDESSSIKMIFSKPIGLAGSNLAEVLDIKEAFLIFVASRWAKDKVLVVESDSINAENDPSTVSWRFRQIIFQIEGFKKIISKWEVNHVLREANGIADGLANSSIDRALIFCLALSKSWLLVWCCCVLLCILLGSCDV